MTHVLQLRSRCGVAAAVAAASWQTLYYTSRCKSIEDFDAAREGVDPLFKVRRVLPCVFKLWMQSHR